MRFLHTMIRVKDLDASLAFYTDILNMRLLRKKDYPAGEFTLAFLGYEEESKAHALELTYNWGQNEYELGSAYGHIAIECEDIYKTCEQVRAKGGKVVREPGPMKGSTSVLAFLEDPDGYKIELLEKK